MTDSKDADKWNKVYSNNEFGFFPPCLVLHQHQHLLPETGKALDLACGMGRNAVMLARQGFETVAIDVSHVAIDKLNEYAEQEDLVITAQACDLNQTPLLKNEFDIIVISHYLNRDLIPSIKQALKKEGVIFYQTFIKQKVEDIGPSNPDYLLDENELLELFKEFQIVVYKEEALLGDTQEGFRNEAMIIARKI